MFQQSDTAFAQALMAYCADITGTLFCLLKKILKVFTTFFLFLAFLILAGNYMFKCNNRNNRIRREICSKLTIQIPERGHWQVDAGWDT